MRIVLDILRADTGRVTWQGTENTELPRRTWGYLPEERGLYPRMKVGEQLRFFAALYGVPEADAQREIVEWLDRFRIPDYLDRKVEELSKGNQQKIQFIAAILHDPDVLIMDEPFTGLDPVNVRLLKEAFLEMRERGKTLIFSTHQMETVEELCESIAIVDRGRVVISGAVRDVKRSHASPGRAARHRRRRSTAPAGSAELPGVTVVAAARRLRRAAGAGRPRSGDDPARRARPRRARDPVRDRRPEPGGGLHRARRSPGGRRGGGAPRRHRSGAPTGAEGEP